jgi:hypothetical protein
MLYVRIITFFKKKLSRKIKTKTFIQQADQKGLCLALGDGTMGKILTKNNNTGDNEFCVLVNIHKA